MPQIAIAVAGLALSAYGTVKSGQQAKKQAKAQQASMAAQQRADDIKQARERRQAVREARLKQAQIVQSGANQGATSTSAVSGGSGSITSQLSSNISFLDSVGGANRDATNANISASRYGASASRWAGVASLGATVFDGAGGFGTIFDGAKSSERVAFGLNKAGFGNTAYNMLDK